MEYEYLLMEYETMQKAEEVAAQERLISIFISIAAFQILLINILMKNNINRRLMVIIIDALLVIHFFLGRDYGMLRSTKC